MKKDLIERLNEGLFFAQKVTSLQWKEEDIYQPEDLFQQLF